MSNSKTTTTDKRMTDEELKETEAYQAILVEDARLVIESLKAALQQRVISKSWTPYYDSQLEK